MDEINSVQIFYFSGTQGTALVALKMSDCFNAHGVETLVSELKDDKPVHPLKFLMVLYPVYDFGAPKPVEEWIKQLQAVQQIPAAIISVSGGGEISPNTACRASAMKGLEQKGYDVCYESMIVMPSNVFIHYDDIVSALLLKKLPIKAEEIVSDILAGKRIRKRPLKIDCFFAMLGSIGRNYGKSFSKHLSVKDTCIGCSWCQNHCPRSNISMHNGKPSFGKECVICLRCVYGCPKKAIHVTGFCKALILKEGYDMKALEQSACSLPSELSLSSIANGYLYSGVRKYLNIK